MDDENAINEWADSFEVGSDDAPAVEEAPVEEVKEDIVEDEPTKSEETSEEEPAKEADSEAEKPNEEPGASDDTEESTGTEEEAGKADDAKPEPTLTRDDLKATLKEIEAEKTSYVEEVKSTAKEVLDSFYPQGIDRQLRDADGDPIKSIDDVMNLTDPRTGENFTEEAAGRWLLEKQQALNKQVEELELSAERVAEVNINLKNDSYRVVEKYGDILSANPKLASQAKALYERTLRKDPKTGITLEAPVDLSEFYDTFLEPYVLGQTQQPAQPPVAEPPKPKANPDDRADLPTTNGNDNLSKEDREWAEIAKEYQEMRN